MRNVPSLPESPARRVRLSKAQVKELQKLRKAIHGIEELQEEQRSAVARRAAVVPGGRKESVTTGGEPQPRTPTATDPRATPLPPVAQPRLSKIEKHAHRKEQTAETKRANAEKRDAEAAAERRPARSPTTKDPVKSSVDREEETPKSRNRRPPPPPPVVKISEAELAAALNATNVPCESSRFIFCFETTEKEKETAVRVSDGPANQESSATAGPSCSGPEQAAVQAVTLGGSGSVSGTAEPATPAIGINIPASVVVAPTTPVPHMAPNVNDCSPVRRAGPASAMLDPQKTARNLILISQYRYIDLGAAYRRPVR
ncbi:hypothetical protein BDK51DRAFT_42179 [Blyttiomyces helicus]|uniref:Uncharacterized protein n=1 Tax=Blyttiomyces helicus TaxID=388810 RepID=A0A4P9VVG6_9FUNG|nr:hypothetical protein BDK51DRAFT_42179 [Blyttiomyces helicus]|eukprot:RKO83641.1 hypothetical protein BDK51DRAFT_42179 [Blyttiomyces helicus]